MLVKVCTWWVSIAWIAVAIISIITVSFAFWQVIQSHYHYNVECKYVDPYCEKSSWVMLVEYILLRVNQPKRQSSWLCNEWGVFLISWLINIWLAKKIYLYFILLPSLNQGLHHFHCSHIVCGFRCVSVVVLSDSWDRFELGIWSISMTTSSI